MLEWLGRPAMDNSANDPQLSFLVHTSGLRSKCNKSVVVNFHQTRYILLRLLSFNLSIIFFIWLYLVISYNHQTCYIHYHIAARHKDSQIRGDDKCFDMAKSNFKAAFRECPGWRSKSDVKTISNYGYSARIDLWTLLLEPVGFPQLPIGSQK